MLAFYVNWSFITQCYVVVLEHVISLETRWLNRIGDNESCFRWIHQYFFKGTYPTLFSKDIIENLSSAFLLSPAFKWAGL